ncbi:apolipoprotein A-IV [Osmerus mordax]|uniref:apolipoprotein A-IV n=1 Tax=Osmerus mordax TaxID=8014 RepID=UPI0035106BFA
MIVKVVIFALSFVAVTAYPLHREAQWTDSHSNQAHDKTELSKDVDGMWKSQVESSNLYHQQGGDNPLGGEIRHKLNMESERLRARLRHELVQLRERLSPLSSYPAQPHFALGSTRERLAPLTQQLQSAVSGSTREMCDQLKLYLQDLEVAEAQPGAAIYREAVQWVSQKLEDNGAKMDAIVLEFQTQASSVIKELRAGNDGEGPGAGPWEELSARLGQEVRSLRQEAQNRVGSLKGELATLLLSGQPLKAEVLSILDQYCKSTTLQNQLFQARIERIVLGLEADHSSSSSSSPQEPDILSFLQEDFSAKLSALLQDIKDSLPSQSQT